MIGARDHKTCSEDSSVASGLLMADDGKQYDWRLIIGLLVVPEVILGLLNIGSTSSICCHRPTHQCYSSRARQKVPQPPESPTAFSDYARVIISALAGVTGVADKIGETRVDPQAAA